MPTDPPAQRRQARLSTKVLITWSLIIATYLAHRWFGTPGWVPIAVLLVSRLFLWPAYPEVSPLVWMVFFGTQASLFIGTVPSVPWGMITYATFGFIIFSDAVLVYRGFRISLERRRVQAE